MVNKAGLQQSAPPIGIAKSPFEYENSPKIFFRYPTLPMPPMAGGKYGIAPVFASSVTFNGEGWNVNRRFDSAGAMHAANEMIWLHNDEINGFPNVDLSKYVTQSSLMPFLIPTALAGVAIVAVILLSR